MHVLAILHIAARRQVPVTLREYLTLMEAIDADLAEQTVENFYYLSRALAGEGRAQSRQVRSRVRHVFKGLESLLDAMEKADIPAEWLKKLAEKYLTEEEKKQIEAMGWDKLMETLRQRLKNRRAATRAATSGSAPPEPRRSARRATIPKASASGSRRTAISAR
jgi:uncharacterized protein with von Willebrand factor type A (vWA) domain